MEINATIFVTSVSFILFIFIMNAILYKPVMKIMEQRQKYIDDNKNAANESHKKAQEMLADKDSKIADAQRKSRDIVASKADALKAERAKILYDTKKNVSDYFAQQKNNLNEQKESVSASMKSDVADLANRLTTKLMGEGVAFEPVGANDIDEAMKNA